MMAVSEYKQKWVVAYEKELNYFNTSPDPFKNWERNTMPEVMASRRLQNGTEVLYADAGHAVANKFFHAAIDMIDRAVADNKFQAEVVVEMSFPKNRGWGLRVRAYALAQLGDSLAERDLIQASHDYEQWCADLHRSDWDSIPQAHILSAARMALIAGDVKRAAEVLSIKRSMKWHAEEFGLLKELAHEAAAALPVRQEDLFARVREFFDRVRDPDYKPNFYMDQPLVRLEWGALINKYFETGGPIDWRRVVELVSE